MNRAIFNEIFTPLTEYYNADLKPSVYNLYYESLKDYDPTLLNVVVRILLKTNKYHKMPLISDFIDILEKKNNLDIQSLKAWELVLNAMVRFGIYESVSFNDKAINRAIKNLGGWIYLNNLNEDELKWAKKEFIEAYKAFFNITKEQIHLSGIYEKENSLKGFEGKVFLIDYDKTTIIKLSEFIRLQNKGINPQISNTFKQIRINNGI